MLPLWLFNMSMACNPIQKQYKVHIETTYLTFQLILDKVLTKLILWLFFFLSV